MAPRKTFLVRNRASACTVQADRSEHWGLLLDYSYGESDTKSQSNIGADASFIAGVS